MTLSHEDRGELSRNYLAKSQDTIKTVDFLIENGEFSLAMNRIYYGIYYALCALAVRNGYKTSKHAQLIGWFNRNFVKTGRADPQYGRFIRKAFENRMEGDYNVFASFEKQEIEIAFNEMRQVITQVSQMLDEV